MSSENTTSKTKLCPVCGTRLSETATRCLVCGSELEAKAEVKSSAKVKGNRLPEVKLSLPALLGIIALFITLAVVLIIMVLKQPVVPAINPEGTPIAEVGTATMTPTITETPTPTATATLEPTWTPLPPVEYTVKEGEVCSGIAYAFQVSINSIILENNLTSDCLIAPGMVLRIPQPTPTASPQPTATLSNEQATAEACKVIDHKVASGETLSVIAAYYGMKSATIKSYNGMVSDVVVEGTYIKIPMCQAEPTPGPTPTPTIPPPYPPANLLLPLDGAAYVSANDVVTLQWSAVAEIRPDERYMITIEDVTSQQQRKWVDYVTDTKYIVPTSYQPDDMLPHLYRWNVTIVRQLSTTESGEIIWEIAGTISENRGFIWVGSGAQQPTPTVQPE